MNNLDEVLKDVDSVELSSKKGAIADDELDAVSGGFREDNAALVSNGLEIQCPRCGAAGVNDIAMSVKVWSSGVYKAVQYTCLKCMPGEFVVYGGKAYPKEQFKQKVEAAHMTFNI